MLKGNCRKKNLTTCEGKISLYKPTLRMLNFSLHIFGHAGIRLDKKAKVSFKIYGITNWITNNYNTHIARYLKK